MLLCNLQVMFLVGCRLCIFDVCNVRIMFWVSFAYLIVATRQAMFKQCSLQVMFCVKCWLCIFDGRFFKQTFWEPHKSLQSRWLDWFGQMLCVDTQIITIAFSPTQTRHNHKIKCETVNLLWFYHCWGKVLALNCQLCPNIFWQDFPQPYMMMIRSIKCLIWGLWSASRRLLV